MFSSTVVNDIDFERYAKFQISEKIADDKNWIPKWQTNEKIDLSVKFYIENYFLKFKFELKPFPDTATF